MNFLIVGVKTTPIFLRFKEEAEKKGHYIEGFLPSQLIISTSNEGVSFDTRGLKKPIEEFDLIYLQSVSTKRKPDIFLFIDYLNKKFGTKIIYQKYLDPSYKLLFTPAYDYKRQFENKIPFPKSYVFFNTMSAKKLSTKIDYPVILKVNALGLGKQGRGVFKIKTPDELIDTVEDYKDIANRFILRQFIPNEGDIRVFIVGYKAIGAMKRTPKGGDFRSNISQGGHGEVFDLNSNPKIKEIAEKLAKLIRAEIAGVDIMLDANTGKPYVLEINHGPQFLGIESLAGINVAEKIIEYFEKVASS